MEPLNASAVAGLLGEIAVRMELAGESPFKFRAYRTAAENLLQQTAPLSELIAKGRLKSIPGVGEAIAEKIIKLHKTGTHPTLEHLREQLPASVLELLQLPGLGTKKVLALHNEHGISTLEQLEAACCAGTVAGLKGFGAALQNKLLKALAFERSNRGLLRLDLAERLAAERLPALRAEFPAVQHWQWAGDLRRGCEVVRGLCAVGTLAPGAAHLPPQTRDALELVFAPPESAGFALVCATGAPAHLEALKLRAAERGLEWGPRGLLKSGVPLPLPDEAAVYAALGLPAVPPELREGHDELDLAEQGRLPVLAAEGDLRGVLHSHTDFSDGTASLETMAAEVRARGFEYYGVTDHSQSAAYARGLTFDRVQQQHKLADRLNEKCANDRFRIFKGIESDILADGALDYAPAELSTFDFIVASIHSRFELGRDAQTRRMLAAIENPHTTILGHLTGRLLLEREPYDLDIDAVLHACARHGVVVEINAHPCRLDLDWRWHRRATELGVLLSINPDAHAVAELDVMRYGLLQARKGGLSKERILNTRTAAELAQYFAARKARAAAGGKS